MVSRKTHCKHGHVLVGTNIYIRPDGYRECKTCRRNTQKCWADTNRKQVREIDRQHYLNNIDNRRKASSQWQKENLDKARAREQKRRALKLNQMGIVSLDIEEILFNKQKGKCFYCDCSLEQVGFHQEHKIPISRGGLHDDSNICLACPPCNMRKHTKTASEFKKLVGGYNGREERRN